MSETRHRAFGGMYVREAGEGTEAIVFVHGLGESALSFEDVLGDRRLQPFRVLAPDLPGYGKSPWLPEPATIPRQADLLARFLGEADASAVHLVGHAMGGVVGLLLCERHPGLVSSFLDVEGNVSLDDCAFSGRAAAFAPEDFASSGFAILLNELFQAATKDPSLRSYFAGVRFCDPRQLHLNSRELVTISRAGKIANRLAALPLRVRYLAGMPRGTGLVSRRRLAEAGVECSGVQNAGHWPFKDQPTAFVEELVDFVRSEARPLAE